MVLVDTDIMIDFLRGYPPALIFLESLGESEIYIFGFVVMELIQGYRNKSEQKKLEQELMDYQKIWPSPETCEEGLTVFSRFHLSQGLGIIDALIGQLAVALNLPLHTFNQKHYAMIPHLKTIQPYQK